MSNEPTFTVIVTKEVEVSTLVATMNIRNIEDLQSDDSDQPQIPGVKGSTWKLEIDLATGTIRDWNYPIEVDVCLKVVDQGEYALLDSSGERVSSIEGYVPNILSPERSGYGDYVNLKISPDGVINKWMVTLDEFNEMEEY